MKQIKIFVTALLILFLSGCSTQQDKRLVKLVTVDKEYISVYYYDYSDEKPSYKTERKANTGIRDTFTQLLSQNQYDLKLCRYAVCSEDVVATEIYDVVSALTDSRFSPDIAVVQGDVQKWDKYIDADTSDYPLYTLKTEGNKITGVIEDIENESKLLIWNNHIFKTLPREQGVIADIAAKVSKKTTCTFAVDEKTMSADLENITVFCTVKENVASVRIDAFVRSYRGMAANQSDRKRLISALEKSIEQDVTALYSDRKTAQCLDLLWIERLGNFSEIKVNCNIR